MTAKKALMNTGAARRRAGLKCYAAMRCVFLVLCLARCLGAGETHGAVRAATLTYGEGTIRNSARCFSAAFLDLVRAHTNVPAAGELTTVALGGETIMAYPFCVLSGEGYFRFTRDEKNRLALYLRNGGFILASAGCSSAAWDTSFREQLGEALPEARLLELPAGHPLFGVLFPVGPLRLKDGTEARLEGLYVEGRLAGIYSRAGLNDTASLPDCCCCTGNELEHSATLNANAFLYALLTLEF